MTMEWIDIKNRIPEGEDIVLVELNYKKKFMCVCIFFDNICTFHGDYNNVFFMLDHPRIHKICKNYKKYDKTLVIKKRNVKRWMLIT